MSETLGIPTETIKLPSGGKVYPVDSPLASGEVEIYHLTARGEDVLTSRNLIKKGNVIDKLLQSAIVNKTINIDDLLLGDKNAIMVAYRITGYGKEYRTSVECPNCDIKTEKIFDLSKMELVGLGVEPITPGSNTFIFITPTSQKKICFKLLIGKDEKEIAKLSESGRGILDVERTVTARLYTMILSVDGENDKSKIMALIDRFPAGDSLAFREYVNEIEPGIDMTNEFECSSCGERAIVDCPIGIEFFWPGWRRTGRRRKS